MLVEIMRIEEVSTIAFIESLLMAEKIEYLIADRNYEGGMGYSTAVRILVNKHDYEHAEELLVDAGFKHQIFPMKKKSK